MKLRNPLVNRATFQAIHDQQLLAAGHRKGSNLFTQTKDHLGTIMLFVSVDNGITIVLVKAFCILYVCANLSFYLSCQLECLLSPSAHWYPSQSPLSCGSSTSCRGRRRCPCILPLDRLAPLSSRCCVRLAAVQGYSWLSCSHRCLLVVST